MEGSNQREQFRDYRFDNLKGLLIFLVVLGHAISHFSSGRTPIASGLYTVIYSFHMPAFILISGYFSKPLLGNAKRSEEKVISSVLLPFVVFHLLMWAVTEHSLAMLFTPAWTMWYLLSLFFWKISIPFISRIRHVLWFSAILSLLIGFTEAGEFMAVSKTVCFFPFFIAGYLLEEKKIKRIRECNRVFPIVVMILLFLIVIILKGHGCPLGKAFTMKASYEAIGVPGFNGVLLRTFAISTGFIITFCLIAVTPEKKTILSELGKNSITIYLGHSFTIGFLQILLPYLGIDVSANDVILLFFTVALTVAISILFGNQCVRRMYNYMLGKIAGVIMKSSSSD